MIKTIVNAAKLAESRGFPIQITSITCHRFYSKKGKDDLETLYAKFLNTESKSLLKKHLKKDIFDKLKNKTTPTHKSTLLDCIRSGLTHASSNVGIYAADPEAYETFADIFNPIIEDYHGGFKASQCHPPSDFGDVNKLFDLDPECKYIVSTRVRCGRSIKGFPFNPKMTEQNYYDLEKCLYGALCSLDGDLKGEYEDLCSMSEDRKKKLIDDHFLFKEGDKYLQTANATRFWPFGRGIFLNEKKTFLAWVNEEDHIRIISMQKGGDLKAVYGRLVNGVTQLGKQLDFMHDKRLGFLTFCSTNLGTTVRASVHIRLPHISSELAQLEKAASEFHLQVRGTAGEHSESVGGVYDISNKRRLGLTEFEAIVEMACGIRALIELEKGAEKKGKKDKGNKKSGRCFDNSVYHC